MQVFAKNACLFSFIALANLKHILKALRKALKVPHYAYLRESQELGASHCQAPIYEISLQSPIFIFGVNPYLTMQPQGHHMKEVLV